jgi:hypothetical protein
MNKETLKIIFKKCNWRFPDSSIEDEYTGRYNFHDLILFVKEYCKIKENQNIMDNITINKIIEPTSELFDSNDNKIGDITSFLQMLDVRLQIKRNNLDGYYFLYKHIKIYIDKNGKLLKYVEGFYDQFDYYIDELLDYN